jgi:hypothetical protein
MAKQTPKRKSKLFHPDKIATEIHQALKRDFSQAQHVYCLAGDTALFALNRQVNEFTKKYLSESSDQSVLEEQAFDTFLKVNAHMAEVNTELRDYFSELELRTINQHTLPVDAIFLRARAACHAVLGNDITLEDVFLRAKHSSGSSQGVPYNNTSPERKFTYPMTVTERAKPLMDMYFSWDSSLDEAVRIAHFSSLSSVSPENPPPKIGRYRYVSGSRATTVDKDNRKRRFISIEATCNMFLQQGLMCCLVERLAKVGLVLAELPELHRNLARESSISLKNATIDMTNASDCDAVELLRFLLPEAWFALVWDLRSDTTSIKNEEVELHMISTMGNATTFPLETLVFWALGVAAVQSETNSRSLFATYEQQKSVSVFGDDCVVPTRLAPLFMEICESVGFIVNEEKSFYDTTFKFRESCGGDFLAGYDVRPFYLKSPTSVKRSALEPWLYIIGNSLLKKYISYFGGLSYIYHDFWRVWFDILKRYRVQLRLVPSYFPDDAGFKGGFDLQRFVHLYRPCLAPISTDQHGTYAFTYCHFRYWEVENRDPNLRYAMWLKIPRLLPGWRKAIVDYPIREKGGYVVAKSMSSHWELPTI